MTSRSVGLVMALVLAGVSGRVSAQERELRLKVVHAQTHEPVAGVEVQWFAAEGDKEAKKVLTDERGECVVGVAANRTKLNLFCRKGTFVPVSLGFGVDNQRPIPQTHTLRLMPGVEVGGVIRDEQGKVVPEARVQLSFEFDSVERPGQPDMAHGLAKADEQGRWTFDGAPAKVQEVSVYTSHPDFVMESFHHRVSAAQFEEMRRKGLVSVIRRGVRVEGVVLDDQGRAVAGAEVTPSQSFGLISCTQTDQAGKFQLRGVEPGKRRLGAKAEGFAVRFVEVAVGQKTEPVELRLEKGKVLRGRVVDQRGRPVADVWLNAAVLNGEQQIYIGQAGKTDAQGKFVWSGAPSEPVILTPYKEGYVRRSPERGRQKSYVAGEQEHEIVLSAPVVLRGSVLDDETRTPIDKFRLEMRAHRDRGYGSTQRTGSNGKFEVTFNFEGETYSVIADADGYLPAESTPVAAGDGPIEVNLRLKKGKATVGTVVQADGNPAAGAEVVLVDRVAPTIRGGVLESHSRRGGTVATSDSAGRFALPPRAGDVKLVALHETGWAELYHDGGDDNAAALRLVLRPWCRVEGRLMKGDKPWAGQMIWIQPEVKHDPQFPRAYSARSYFRYEATSDERGNFAFDRVVDGEVAVAVYRRSGRSYPKSHEMVLTLSPGERRTGLQVGGVGRPIVGKVVIPEGLSAAGMEPPEGRLWLEAPQLPKPADWNELPRNEQRRLRQEFEQSAVYRQYMSRVREINAAISADGSLRAEDVPAGNYKLHAAIYAPKPGDPSHLRYVASAGIPVTIPEMPGGRSEQALDVGEIKLQPHYYHEVGEFAPPFEAVGFDGKRVKLSDYRGKYVLMDFWATWCGPCIEEMKNLERVYGKYGKDGRLAMISVSVDEKMDEAAGFLEGRKLPWRQAYSGALDQSPARRMFGVEGLPSIWLIDPEGKIVAKELSGERIDAAVERALGVKR